MTGKERIKTAMLGGIPDRVPFMPQICYPHAVTQLEKDYVAGIIKCVEDHYFRMEIMFEITKYYGSDGFRIQRVSDIPLKVAYTDGKYIVYRKDTMQREGMLDLVTGNIIPDNHPVKNIDDAKSIRVPDIDSLLSSREFSIYKDACTWAGDEYIKVGSISMGMDYLIAQRGTQNALYDLFDEEEMVRIIFEKGTQNAITRAKALQKCGIDTIYLGDAGSSCSVISPQIFNDLSFPYLKEFVDEIKTTGLIIYAHICGNVAPILDRIADLGVSCIEPMDPLGGISPLEFRKRLGKRVSLMGGVNTVTLSNGTPDDVKREAVKCIQEAGLEGGYILAAGDMVPFETPRDNIFAMKEAAYEHRY